MSLLAITSIGMRLNAWILPYSRCMLMWIVTYWSYWSILFSLFVCADVTTWSVYIWEHSVIQCVSLAQVVIVCVDLSLWVWLRWYTDLYILIARGSTQMSPSLVQKQCVSSVPSCRIGSCIGGEEVQIHECPQFGTNRKCMCVLSVPSCRLDVDIRVSAGLTSDQHVTIINVWYNNAHGVHPFVELQISTSPEATPSTGDVSSISSQSLGPAKRVEHLPSSVNMVCHFATSKTNAVQMILY